MVKDRWSLAWEPLWFEWRRRGSRNGRWWGRHRDRYFRCWWFGPLSVMRDMKVGD